MVTRQVIEPLELPRLLNVANRVEVIFRGCTPEPITEPGRATSLVAEAQARGGDDRVPEPDRHKPWPRAWTWAIVLAVLLFGAHATMRWWGQALVQVLFGDIRTPTDAPPLVWALLGCWFILSFAGGKVIGSLIADGSSIRERHRWQQQQAERQAQWALQRQLWKMERHIRREPCRTKIANGNQSGIDQREAEIRREARRRLGLAEEEHDG